MEEYLSALILAVFKLKASFRSQEEWSVPIPPLIVVCVCVDAKLKQVRHAAEFLGQLTYVFPVFAYPRPGDRDG